MQRRLILALGLGLAACGGFREASPDAGDPGAAGSPGTAGNPGSPGTAGTAGSPGTAGSAGSPGTPGSAGSPGTPGSAGSPGTPGSAGDGGSPGDGGAFVPGAACRPFALDCLDATPANVIEVPTEMTLAQALAAATSGTTIQLRGGSITSVTNVPPYVTLRGCQGARIEAAVRFAGSGGTLEGFVVTSTLVANTTGSFIVRRNRFEGTASEAAVSARVVDGLVNAQITEIVEDNLFVGRASGVEARTYYDTGARTVDITVRNNVFTGVANPITISEAGLTGVITPRLEHNTLHSFKQGVRLYAVALRTVTSGNLFASGVSAFDGDSPYDVAYTLFSGVAGSMPPMSTIPAIGAAGFVDAANGDFRLGPGSAALDAVPAGTAVPGLDFHGCPRPRDRLGGGAKADIGATETQP